MCGNFSCTTSIVKGNVMATILCPRCHTEVFRSIKDPTANMQCDNCGLAFWVDRTGDIADVREAILTHQGVDLDSIDSQQSAWTLVVAMGRCKLFGIPLPQDCILPQEALVQIGTKALLFAKEHLAELARQAENLDEQWSERSSFEKDDLCCSLLEARMNVHGASMFIHEIWQEAIGMNPLPEKFLSLDFQESEWIDNLDEKMQEEVETLSTIVDLPMLENWRKRMVGGEFEGLFPWWLDGTLEKVAEELHCESLAMMPSRAAILRWAERNSQ